MYSQEDFQQPELDFRFAHWICFLSFFGLSFSHIHGSSDWIYDPHFACLCLLSSFREWVKSFKLYFSLKGSRVQVYREGTSAKVFYANTDQNTVKVSVPQLALAWHTKASLNFNVVRLMSMK